MSPAAASAAGLAAYRAGHRRGSAISETSTRVRDTRAELAADLRARGFRVEAGPRGNDDIMWARRGDLTTAVLVTDRMPRSLEELALRISLGDWAEGHRDREFVFVRCLSKRPGAAAQRRANRHWERLLAVAVKLAGGILHVLS